MAAGQKRMQGRGCAEEFWTHRLRLHAQQGAARAGALICSALLGNSGTMQAKCRRAGVQRTGLEAATRAGHGFSAFMHVYLSTLCTHQRPKQLNVYTHVTCRGAGSQAYAQVRFAGREALSKRQGPAALARQPASCPPHQYPGPLLLQRTPLASQGHIVMRNAWRRPLWGGARNPRCSEGGPGSRQACSCRRRPRKEAPGKGARATSSNERARQRARRAARRIPADAPALRHAAHARASPFASRRPISSARRERLLLALRFNVLAQPLRPGEAVATP
jgi:hypothetical protein